MIVERIGFAGDAQQLTRICLEGPMDEQHAWHLPGNAKAEDGRRSMESFDSARRGMQVGCFFCVLRFWAGGAG